MRRGSHNRSLAESVPEQQPSRRQCHVVFWELQPWNAPQSSVGIGYGRCLIGMRIAIPIHSFEPGGVERVALRLAEHWRDAGHEPVIILGRGRGACAGSVPDLDYRVMREPFSTDGWETIWMIWSFFQFLLVEKVDAIFCPGNTYTVVCVAM